MRRKEKSRNSSENSTHRGFPNSGSFFGLPNLTRRTPMKTGRWTKCMLVVAIFMLSIVSKVVAAEKAFYEGKTLTVLINYAAGGPTDVEGRIIAKHLSKHIPGRPTLIVQNMGGAGGVTATNYLGEVSKPDGLTLGYFTGALFHFQLKEGTRLEASKYPFISGVESVAVSYIRSDVPPGIKRPEDLIKAHSFKAGGLATGSSKDVRFRLSFDFLAEAMKLMRFQPRFQIGEEGIKLYQQITQISPEIVTFLKDFIAQHKK